jgi:hydroxyacylglutathione hydrolase
VPASTVGYEKLVNWGVSSSSEDLFVRSVLEGQPDPPAYFARMKRLNRDGPPPLPDRGAPARMSERDASAALAAGAVLVDVRRSDAFATGHVRGAINIPVNRSFTKYAGSLVPYDTALVLVSSDDAGLDAAEAAKDLALIGLEDVAGYVAASAASGLGAIEASPRVPIEDAKARHAAGAVLIDVRDAFEWDAGHVPGARHIPLARITERADEIPRGEPVLLYCQTGSRSALAASALRRLGVDAHDAGGIVAWERSGGRVETGAER